MKRLVVLVTLAIWSSGCSVGPGPKEVMGKYLDATYGGRKQEAYSLLSSRDRTAGSLDAYSRSEGAANPFMEIVGLKDSWKVSEIRTEGDKARATVEIVSPDAGGAFGEVLREVLATALGGQQDGKALEKALADKLQGKNWPTTTRTEYYDLVKEEDGWKVFLNYEGMEKARELKSRAEGLGKQKRYAEARSALEEAAALNPRDPEIPAKIREMDGKALEYKEKRMYFDKIEVRDVRVEQRADSRFGVSGELKNRGDRILREVEVTVYCLDKAGNVVSDETYLPVSATGDPFRDSRPLKPNYVRKFGYPIDGAPAEWARKVTVSVTNVEFQP